MDDTKVDMCYGEIKKNGTGVGTHKDTFRLLAIAVMFGV